MKRTILAFLCCIFASAGAAHAGTTGGLTGIVLDDAGVPIAGAHVYATSPAQKEQTYTDAQGHFFFLCLAPDVYTVTTEKTGYGPVSFAGAPIFADNTVALAFKLPKRLTTIVDFFIPNRYVRRGIGEDVTLLHMYEFRDFENPVAASLSTVPGVLVGSGGSYMH